MMNKGNVTLSYLFMALFCCSCSRVVVPQMSDFDSQKYLGTWYEIARLDHSFERDLEQVTAHYDLREDGKISVLNRGYNTKKMKWSEADAYAIQTDVPNYLKVYFFPLIPGKYRIAYLNEAYTLAVVSGGSLKYLWLLARTPTISDADRDTVLEVARSMGYDTSKLLFIHQQAAQ